MLHSKADMAHQLTLQSGELERLRHQASHAPQQALKGVAQQFEALFLNSLLKSMREASSGEGLFDNEQTKLYTSMLDQQLAQTMSKRGIGLADMMVRQLRQEHAGGVSQAGAEAPSSVPVASTNVDIDPLATMRHPALARRPAQALEHSFTREVLPQAPAAQAAAAEPVAQRVREPQYGYPTTPKNTAQSFVERLAPHAREVSADIGIPQRFLLAQAALESGWGRHEPRFADGSNSHNLFGIKADRSWKGATVEVATTEYVNGRRERVMAKFRAYDSYAEAFRDYADFLRSNRRYAPLLGGQHDAVSFAQGLQRAGYATDPRYAEKLASVINGRSMRTSLIA